jgi:arylsulfatase A-like enzyme
MGAIDRRAVARLAPLVPLLALWGCTPSREPVDFLKAEGRLQDATVAGRDRSWVLGQTGKPVRLNDVVRRTVPASPPSRLRFTVDIPAGARLAFACGIAPDRHERPGVEFAVKAARGGREEIVWRELIDPLNRPAHRRWVTAEVDLAPYAGRGVEVVFETRGFDEGDGEARRAFWGAPALIVPDRPAPVVIVYLVDTLRADHTGPYGYHRDTTPQLDAFAKDAVVFEQAIAQASWTKPSVASVFTSLLPGRHRAVQLRDVLDGSLMTMAEMFSAKGYATGAAIANSVIYTQGVNFDQGFDVFAGLHGAEGRPSKLVDAAVVVDAALGFLDSRKGLPTVLYVHTMDPHVPYAPPPPFDRKYEPHPPEGRPLADPRTDLKEDGDRERLIAQYDGDIAYGDQEFGRFVQGLKERGLYDGALIVFLADHGEEFQDHGQWLHGRSVFDELIRIPLIVKFPGGRHAGRRVKEQVQELDVLPTLLESQGMPVPKPPDIEGRPLQAVLRGEHRDRPALSEISHRGFVAHGMRTVRDKYVQRFSPDEDELYFDLTRDPREQVNRIGEARERVRHLKAGVEAAMVTNPFRHVVKLVAPGEYVLKLRTGGWIERLEAAGFGPAERHEVQGNGRKLEVKARPRTGAPREVSFSLRPMGAPVWLEGTRDGRPLTPADVFIAEQGRHPPAVPVRLPDLESEGDKAENLFAAPAVDRPGVHAWLVLIPGRRLMVIDRDACERFLALGYVNQCN